MQYGLGIIFETQLSHKTKRGQRSDDRGQKTGIGGQEFVSWVLIKRKAHGLRLKMILSYFALSLKPIFYLSGLYLGPL